MKPEQRSENLLSITRSKAKMLEYDIPERDHIKIPRDPAELFSLSIGMLGDLAARVNRGEEIDQISSEYQESLIFSAYFFDAYFESKLNEKLDPYLILLSSASYYLCELPGSSTVLINRLTGNCPDLDGQGLEDFLFWLLRSDFSENYIAPKGLFEKHIKLISNEVVIFFREGVDSGLIDFTMQLRLLVYELGTPRQLLFADVLSAVIRKKIKNSSWVLLPFYSGLSKDKWIEVLQRKSFIKEFWPAQHLLGKAGVLRGESVVVQMPTSSGKTKAIELIIRSSFLARRTLVAIIIAPFRALCHEIKDDLTEAFYSESVSVDELSDVLQADFEFDELYDHKRILIVTPEKLLYALRSSRNIILSVGLVIFDEGHQFDSGARGVSYELLLTSLRRVLFEGAQKILISAVLTNADSIAEWLNSDTKVILGKELMPMFKSVGFASWKNKLGILEYVDINDIEKKEFFVPRVIEELTLGRRGRERKNRVFPKKKNPGDIALYLGLKLVSKGGVAIFCGKKSGVSKLCETISENFSRNLLMEKPEVYSDFDEVLRIGGLIERNLGITASATKSAKFGIFAHHGDIPHGIRLAIEHAMRENLIQFVICTSTLAQGVNLPIRYLIIASLHQGLEEMKTRDFHNLIGRVGRSGMHTEGTIIFSNPEFYDEKNKNQWRWQQIKKMFSPNNTDGCASSLLSIFDPIKNGTNIINIDLLSFVREYISNPNIVDKICNQIDIKGEHKAFKEDVERQIRSKIIIILAMESFLLSEGDLFLEEDIANLFKETLAFFLADEDKKCVIQEVFKVLAENISKEIDDPVRRRIYGKTLYGLYEVRKIEAWLNYNIANLLNADNSNAILDLVWPLLYDHINNDSFKKINSIDALAGTIKQWVNGSSFSKLFDIISSSGAQLGFGARPKNIKIDHIVNICEGGFSHHGSLVIGALIELADFIYGDESVALRVHLQLLQKQLKYGLPTEATIALYEMGFSDRVIALELASSLDLINAKKEEVIEAVKNSTDQLKYTLKKYPKFFQDKLSQFS